MPEQSLSQLANYSAIAAIQVNDQFNEKISNSLLGMEMREREASMSSMELRFGNFASFAGGVAGPLFEDGKLLQLGASLVVGAGDVTNSTEIFRGRVTAIEGIFPRDMNSPEIVVLLEDNLQTARMRRRTKIWDGSSVAAIVNEIAAELGLKPVVAGLDFQTGEGHQFNESDLHFLQRVLARYDADFRIIGDQLHVSPRSMTERPPLIQLDLYSQLLEVRVLADLAHQVTQVTATGWDYQQGDKISVSNKSPNFGLGSGMTGSDWLRQAMSPRSEQLGQFSSLNEIEAQALVDARFLQRSRRFTVAHGVAQGNPRLRVGSWLNLTGLGPRFSNTYYTTEAVHRWDTEHGYETEFTAECAYLGKAA